MPERKKGKKNRKHGRNKLKCAAYTRSNKHVRSHIRRLEKHLSKFPGDKQAIEALERYKE